MSASSADRGEEREPVPSSITCAFGRGLSSSSTPRARMPRYPCPAGEKVPLPAKDLDRPFTSSTLSRPLRWRSRTGPRFNPLDALNPDNEETIDEAGRLADAIVVIHESNDPFWDESARAMVKGLILHILTAEEYDGRRNLITLRKLITRGDWEAVEALRQSGESDIPPAHALLWTSLTTNRAFEGLIAGIGDTFTNMLLNSPKQYESVLQVANRNTEFIDSPAMQRCLETSDFTSMA